MSLPLQHAVAELRAEVVRLAGEIAQCKPREPAGPSEPGGLAELRAEVERLTQGLERARREAKDLAAQVNELRADREENAALIQALEARLAELEAMQGPPRDFMGLPLVFRSEQGEYLGVCDKQTSQHFSLSDFVYLIHKNAGGRGDVDTSWERVDTRGWRLLISEPSALHGGRKRHHMVVERFGTPKGNLVARLVELCFDGKAVPPFFVYELFRQIGRDFG